MASHHYLHLKKKWAKKHAKIQTSLWEKHADALQWLKQPAKHIVTGSLAGTLLFSGLSALPAPLSHLLAQNKPLVEVKLNKAEQMRAYLANILPSTVQPLTDTQEREIGQKLSELFNMKVSAELDGKRLNRSYGLIGQEQHLTRFPGDVVENMAPGRGAWGYFGSDQLAIEREKYYIAVPTFLAPGWKADPNGHYRFFRFRKMLVINPENGKAIVADIGDSGPAEFTGKHLGGSPEVMQYLERVDGAQKGPVLYFFIDDKDNTVPLGPITIK